ncbi:monovalent cation:proton antiporter-2 (CPA2) family protein [Pseudovibrio exalbescens]|uniref:monovalent cation:proton antiporter-2 (CPA2) family protein n=1 Tax=Pseudovibrio exalbescens TaxID=197461 RepID=UPI002365510D|nr:monovalent cation:proton antiporter-2 (CPA2) family protein [Pseudovibrio exalbescens]MDD7911306.1 monovalent cation:proton antiporter-2 (CPA2) family protein [Pseudovibrio exalbescens]
MAEPHVPPFFVETIMFLSAAVVAVPLAKRIGLGSVVGYLLAGLAIGPFGLNFFSDAHQILTFAELGVVLLLFVIGLELEPARLWKMKRDIFGLGSSQVIVSGIVLCALLWLIGQPMNVALVAGFGLALSSTAFAIQILQERGQLGAPYGQRAFGILLFQDMSIVPLLSMVALLSPKMGPSSYAELAFEVVMIVGAVAGVVLAGRYLLSPVFSFLASSRAREVMLAAALLVALGSAGLMQLVGLSMALGAFLSGVMLAESSFRHTLEADIEPFRSLLMGLFFIAVGMALQLDIIAANWLIVAVGVLALMLIKGIIIWALARTFGSNNSDALRIAVTLPQGGEFAFVLFAAAAGSAILPLETNNILTAIVILSMLLTPIAGMGLDFVAARLNKAGVTSEHIEGFSEAHPSVLIVGFGRFGMMVSQMLTSEGISITALDNRPDRINYARKLGYSIYYGDATRLDVLKAAGGDTATLIALCIENDQVMRQAVKQIRAEFPKAAIYCRATDRAHALDLHRLGVDFQIRETFESSLVFGRTALSFLGLPQDRISEIEADVRARDEERLQMQLEGGTYAGSEKLHQRTPSQSAASHARPQESNHS